MTKKRIINGEEVRLVKTPVSYAIEKNGISSRENHDGWLCVFDGVTYPHLAITRRLDVNKESGYDPSAYNVTHIQSGLALGSRHNRTREQAIEYLAGIRKIVDWSKKKFTKAELKVCQKFAREFWGVTA